jgi:hypothetical protein
MYNKCKSVPKCNRFSNGNFCQLPWKFVHSSICTFFIFKVIDMPFCFAVSKSFYIVCFPDILQQVWISIRAFSDLRQVGGFLQVLQFPPPIKPTGHDITETCELDFLLFESHSPFLFSTCLTN